MAKKIQPIKKFQRNNEFPSFLYSFQGRLTSFLSRATLCRNINFPRELTQITTETAAINTMIPAIIRLNQTG